MTLRYKKIILDDSGDVRFEAYIIPSAFQMQVTNIPDDIFLETVALREFNNTSILRADLIDPWSKFELGPVETMHVSDMGNVVGYVTKSNNGTIKIEELNGNLRCINGSVVLTYRDENPSSVKSRNSKSLLINFTTISKDVETLTFVGSGITWKPFQRIYVDFRSGIIKLWEQFAILENTSKLDFQERIAIDFVISDSDDHYNRPRSLVVMAQRSPNVEMESQNQEDIGTGKTVLSADGYQLRSESKSLVKLNSAVNIRCMSSVVIEVSPSGFVSKPRHIVVTDVHKLPAFPASELEWMDQNVTGMTNIGFTYKGKTKIRLDLGVYSMFEIKILTFRKTGNDDNDQSATFRIQFTNKSSASVIPTLVIGSYGLRGKYVLKTPPNGASVPYFLSNDQILELSNMFGSLLPGETVEYDCSINRV